MYISYNGKAQEWPDLDEALAAFKAPLKKGDLILVNKKSYYVEAIRDQWMWAFNFGDPSNLYLPGLNYSLPGHVDLVYTTDIVDVLEGMRDARDAQPKAGDTFIAKGKVHRAKEAVNNWVLSTDGSWFLRDICKKYNAKFIVGDIVKSYNKKDNLYKIVSVTGDYVDVEVVVKPGLRFNHKSASYFYI